MKNRREWHTWEINESCVQQVRLTDAGWEARSIRHADKTIRVEPLTCVEGEELFEIAWPNKEETNHE